MVVIAVTGLPGSGKSSLLVKTAAWCLKNGYQTFGFVCPAINNRPEGSGSEEYEIRQVRTGFSIPFAQRGENGYTFSDDGWKFGRESIDESVSGGILFLDEFGKLEASGRGWMQYWPEIEAANPGVIVMVVRETELKNIEVRLNQPFSAIFHASDPRAFEKLTGLLNAEPDWSAAGRFGALAGGVEWSVGTGLHVAQLPLRGLVLSSIQSAVLTAAANKLVVKSRTLWVSVISAGLKSLSPSGSRLRPMLAITIQGFLFSLAIATFRWNAFAVFAGGFLCGAWASIQGLALQYFFTGTAFLTVLDTIFQWVVAQFPASGLTLFSLLAGWVAVWGIVAGSAAAGVFIRLTRGFDFRISLPETSMPATKKNGATPAWKMGALELLRWTFWVPLVFIAVLLWSAGAPLETQLWTVFRTTVSGWVLFSLAYRFDFLQFATYLRNKGLGGPSLAVQAAIATFKKPADDSNNVRQ